MWDLINEPFVKEEEKKKDKHVYIYTILGESRAEYQVKNEDTKLSNPMPIAMSFQSKTKYDIKNMNVSAISNFPVGLATIIC